MLSGSFLYTRIRVKYQSIVELKSAVKTFFFFTAVLAGQEVCVLPQRCRFTAETPLLSSVPVFFFFTLFFQKQDHLNECDMKHLKPGKHSIPVSTQMFHLNEQYTFFFLVSGFCLLSVCSSVRFDVTVKDGDGRKCFSPPKGFLKKSSSLVRRHAKRPRAI